MIEISDKTRLIARLEIAREVLRSSYADADDLSREDVYFDLVRATDAVNQAVDKLKKGN